MTDPLLTTLSELDDDPLPAGRAGVADRLADGALQRARRRTRRRRAAAGVAVPLVAAAAAALVSVVPSLLPGLAGVPFLGPADEPERSAPWGTDPTVDVLLLGSDATSDRVGWRADTVILAHVDTRTGDTVLLGLPRNRFGRTGPDGRWQVTSDPRDAALEPQVEQLTGITPDVTVRLDMAGFAEAVDALGGVDVTVRSRLPIGGKRDDAGLPTSRPTEWIEPGRQHLDGRTAMWFARSRWSTDDYDRMRRQRCLVGALVDQVPPQRLLAAAPGLLRVLGTHVSTTVRVQDLPQWVGLLEKVRTARIRSAVLAVPVLREGRPDHETTRAVVASTLATPATPGPGPTASDGIVATGAPALPWAAQDLTEVC